MTRSRPLATVLAAALAPAALAGEDVLWSVPQPSGSVYGTNYSAVYDTVFPYDTEVADDFEATGLVEHIVATGRGCGQCSTPEVNGVHVRFYEWTGSGPGALQSETYVPAGRDFTWGGSYPYTLDITLPEPVAVSGWHFISIQVEFGATGGVWNFVQANRFDAINATVYSRDNLAGDPWAPDAPVGGQVDADVALTLYGTAAAATPVIDAVSSTTVRPSDRIIVNGSGFGAPGSGQLLVAGLPALVTSWSSTEIIGYVPEGIPSGPAELTAVNLGAAGDPVTVTVVPRAPNGRVRWVFEGAGDYSIIRPTAGPDGTLYFDDIDGNLYAMSADGGLLWIADALLGQQGSADEGPIAVGADGTIYVATNPLGPTVELVAFNPDGSHRWTFTVPSAITWQAGPNLGPDGRLYGALNGATLLDNAYDVFAVDLDGTLAWSRAADPFVLEDAAPGSDVVFAASSPGGPVDQMLFTADRNGDGRNWGFDLSGGSQNFATPIFAGNDVGQTQLAANATSGDFYMLEFGGLGGAGWGLQAFDADGERTWRFDPGIASGATRPAVGADGAIYFGWDLGRLSAVEPDGSERWTTFQEVIYGGPVPSPTAPLLLAPGRLGFNQPSFVEARHAGNGSLLWSQPLVDDLGADVSVSSRPRFAADGDTAYFTALELPITPTSTFRVFAVDTSDGGEEPVTADVTGDGAVNIDDLIAVNVAWGPCPAAAPCPADVDGAGSVDVEDLVAVIVHWS